MEEIKDQRNSDNSNLDLVSSASTYLRLTQLNYNTGCYRTRIPTLIRRCHGLVLQSRLTAENNLYRPDIYQIRLQVKDGLTGADSSAISRFSCS